MSQLEEKTCYTCKNSKSRKLFSASPITVDGLASSCKKCDSDRHKANRLNNPDHFKEKNRLNYLNDKENRIRKAKEYYTLNKQRILDRSKNCSEAEREKHALKDRVYYQENKEAIIQKAAAYRDKNREAIRANLRLHYKNNRPMHYALINKRRADKIQRTPPWANLEALRQVYENCPPGKVVDHIVPLRGKNVSGLHVHYNLQYLTPLENSRKSNRF